MTSPMFLFASLALFSSAAFSEMDNDGYNEHTILPSDIPSDAPRFENFTADVFSGRNTSPKLQSAAARPFRTRLAKWAKERPNFAGHYILATWGCGTDCTQITIIDAITGVVYRPVGTSTNVAVNVHHDFLKNNDLWHATGAVKFRPDSRLLVLIGTPEERTENRGISYFVWDRNKMKRIRFVEKP